MKIFIITFVFLMYTLNLYAGDYRLTISDEPSSACSYNAKKYGDNLNYPVCSTNEIVSDLESYFKGDVPKLGIFKAVFTNARITFCTPQSKEIILITITNAISKPVVFNEWDAYDYLYMLGTPDILKEINNRLMNVHSPIIKKRLQRAKKSVELGLEERKSH